MEYSQVVSSRFTVKGRKKPKVKISRQRLDSLSIAPEPHLPEIDWPALTEKLKKMCRFAASDNIDTIAEITFSDLDELSFSDQHYMLNYLECQKMSFWYNETRTDDIIRKLTVLKEGATDCLSQIKKDAYKINEQMKERMSSIDVNVTYLTSVITKQLNDESYISKRDEIIVPFSYPLKSRLGANR